MLFFSVSASLLCVHKTDLVNTRTRTVICMSPTIYLMWRDATFVMRDCGACLQCHLMLACASARAFFVEPLLLMKLYVHVCCRRKTHFWITTCPASSRYLRTNDRDSADYLLISVSTTHFIYICVVEYKLTRAHSEKYVLRRMIVRIGNSKNCDQRVEWEVEIKRKFLPIE